MAAGRTPKTPKKPEDNPTGVGLRREAGVTDPQIDQCSRKYCQLRCAGGGTRSQPPAQKKPVLQLAWGLFFATGFWKQGPGSRTQHLHTHADAPQSPGSVDAVIQTAAGSWCGRSLWCRKTHLPLGQHKGSCTGAECSEPNIMTFHGHKADRNFTADTKQHHQHVGKAYDGQLSSSGTCSKN
jgi:hypothetical protein